MEPIRIKAWASVALLPLLIGSQVLACGFDGLIGDSFSAQHPKSMQVAFAISDAVAAGAVRKSAIAPIEVGQKGYWKAMGHLARFQQMLSEGLYGGTAPPSISILLIDSQLWTRLRAEPGGYSFEAHTAGPASDDVVIVTNEAILSDIEDGALSMRTAISLGVLVIDGDSDRTMQVRESVVDLSDPNRPRQQQGLGRKPVAIWGNRSSGL